MTWLHRVKFSELRSSNSRVQEGEKRTPPRRPAIWLRSQLAAPLLNLAKISTEFCGDQYSVLFHLFARGRPCYAALDTR